MPRARILVCAFDAPNFTGGPNSWLRRWSAFLTAQDCEIRALVLVSEAPSHRLPEDYPLLRWLDQQGIGFDAFPYWETIEKKIHWILAQVAAFRPTVFVSNFVIPAMYASPWLRPAGLPTIGVIHSDDAYHRALLERFVAGQPDYRLTDVVTVSRYLTSAVEPRATSETSVHCIPYGVPVPDATAHWTEGEPLRLLYAGRLEEEQKRISDVTRALCRAAQLPNVTATIAGDGRARPAVERIIAEEGRGRVAYVGLVDNARIQALMAEHHVFVLLSDYEGLPIALMEAMAAGLVPICTPMRSGIGELIDDGRTGVITPDRADGFLAAVKSLAASPDTWRRLSQGARRHIITAGYSLDDCLSRWLDLLTKRSQAATYDGRPLLRRRTRRLGLPPPHPDLEEDQWREPSPLVYYSRVGRAKLQAAVGRLFRRRRT
ncbi:MAG: glycosyltransferase family 4 protein [Chloracidobacterium sp.]|nr:glycosyltransferase family 4 protein [Chloracidobacterium sp.]MDW8217992.1 glycosyltransferase family 4 protein [Acidobacteriota bacterium]